MSPKALLRSPSEKKRDFEATTCALCESDRFCAAWGRMPNGTPLRCTLDPGHAGSHVACGERSDEHPIFRWKRPPPKQRNGG